MTKNNKKLNRSYQYPKEDKEILTKMRHPDYEGNYLLPANASLLDKTKYRICERILNYKYDNKLTTEEVAERINLSVPETKEILFCHIHKFTLDRLITYFDNLHIPFEITITSKSSTKREIKITNSQNQLNTRNDKLL